MAAIRPGPKATRPNSLLVTHCEAGVSTDRDEWVPEKRMPFPLDQGPLQRGHGPLGRRLRAGRRARARHERDREHERHDGAPSSGHECPPGVGQAARESSQAEITKRSTVSRRRNRRGPL
ncbi:hypothetical protein GCM10023259_075860 [Thermocatellispora tengchongensis]